MAVVRAASISSPKAEPSLRAVNFIAFATLILVGLSIVRAAWPHATETADPVGAAQPVEGASQLPVGLILPVRLEKTLDLKDAHKGMVFQTRIMQEVPLPDREKIPLKSIVNGSVLALKKDSDGTGLSLTIAFTTLEDRKQTLNVSTSLRAISSYQAVRAAQTPWTGADVGSPEGWSNTVQIGGDIRYGDGGTVRNDRKQKVGKGVLGGVLVHVYANPNAGCEGPINGDDHLQALWVFSADACGVYHMKDIKITHAGRSDPFGEITLHFAKSDMKLEAGTAMLLRVVEKP